MMDENFKLYNNFAVIFKSPKIIYLRKLQSFIHPSGVHVRGVGLIYVMGHTMIIMPNNILTFLFTQKYILDGTSLYVYTGFIISGCVYVL